MRIRDIGLVYECQYFDVDLIFRILFFVFVGYENLIKAFEKARRVLEKDQGLPRQFIKILAQLDDFVNLVKILIKCFFSF